MDPGTGLVVLGGAIGSKELLIKILGPTADYIGGGVQDWTKRSVENVGRIFNKAKEKLGDRLSGPGTVPPKVLKGVLASGAFCDDELGAEYFGGVLASSRTEISRDDRGAALLALLDRLTTYQLRSHYFLYKVIQNLYSGIEVNIGMPSGRDQLKTFIPFKPYWTAMDFAQGENADAIMSHVFFGLVRENLIEQQFGWGGADTIRTLFAAANAPGIVFSPSVLGVELFLWAHGRGDLLPGRIVDPALSFNVDFPMPDLAGTRGVSMVDRVV